MLKSDLTLVASAPTHVVCQNLEEAFRQAQNPDVNLVVCRREADEAITSFIQLVYPVPFPPVSRVVSKGMIRDQLSDALADYTSLHDEGARRLTADMAMQHVFGRCIIFFSHNFLFSKRKTGQLRS